MLRPVILALCLMPLAAFAQQLPDATTHDQIIDDRQREAEILGEDLKSRLKFIERDFGLPEDLAERALESLKNERVRDILNIGPDDLPQANQEDRYPGGVYLFASFSIPEPSLKAMLVDADRFGIPVVFNGFVENSVTATEARVRSLYEDEEISQGFIIDPTLFTRFDVRAVPTLVTTTANLDVCDSSGCADDPQPHHDRVAGNVPLTTLMTIIAKGNTADAAPVQALLEASQ